MTRNSFFNNGYQVTFILRDLWEDSFSIWKKKIQYSLIQSTYLGDLNEIVRIALLIIIEIVSTITAYLKYVHIVIKKKCHLNVRLLSEIDQIYCLQFRLFIIIAKMMFVDWLKSTRICSR